MLKIIFLILLIALSGCSNDVVDSKEAFIEKPSPPKKFSPINQEIPIVEEKIPKFDKILLNGSGQIEISECKKRGLDDKIIIISSHNCSISKNALPDFLDVCTKQGVNPLVWDGLEIDGRQNLEDSGLRIVGTPTFLFGCKYRLGVMTKEEYLVEIDSMRKV